jgi:hypothetical protein
MWPSIVDLYEKGAEFIQWYRARKLDRKYDRTQAARLNPLLTQYLASCHTCPILSRAGLSYPVTAITCPSDQREDPESILGDLSQTHSSDFIVNAPGYLDTLRRQGRHLYNAPTYTLRSVDQNGPLRINCGLGRYFDAMTTCDALEWELLNLIGDSTIPESDFPALSARLPLRTNYLEHVSNPVLDGVGRSAAISISTLIAFKVGSTYKGFLRARSGKTAAHADLYHVVPSFMFQPQAGDIAKEYSVRHNIFREYLEEVFGVEEVQTSGGEIAFDWFYSHEKLKDLLQLLRDGGAQLLLTGYAVNLLNYRPEICTLLLINDEDWCKQRIVTNYEFATPEESWAKGKEFMLPIDIMKCDAEISQELEAFPGTFVPPGAAAFWLGVDVARERITAG